MKISEYKKFVDRAYENSLIGRSMEISNSSKEHASIVVEYLFQIAEKKRRDVKILTGELEDNFYKKFNGVIKRILKNNKVSIISFNKLSSDNVLANTIRESNRNGKLAVVDANKVKPMSHFILVGDYAYRYEKDDVLSTATADFYNKEKVSFLNLLFNFVEGRCL